MGPIPEEFTYKYWLSGPTTNTNVTCLMPNGICIVLNVSHNATLAEIKEVSLSTTVYCSLSVT